MHKRTSIPCFSSFPKRLPLISWFFFFLAMLFVQILIFSVGHFKSCFVDQNSLNESFPTFVLAFRLRMTTPFWVYALPTIQSVFVPIVLLVLEGAEVLSQCGTLLGASCLEWLDALCPWVGAKAVAGKMNPGKCRFLEEETLNLVLCLRHYLY